MDNGASSYRRYLNGDEEAFQQIVSLYFDGVLRFVGRYVNDTATAEDITLDVFVQLVVHKYRYDFRVSLKTYLYMLGRSRALDYLRYKRRQETVELTETVQMVSRESGPEEQMIRRQRMEQLNAALKRLPPEQKEAMELVYYEELSCDEVARVMHKTRKQIYNLLYRGKKICATALDRRWNGCK